MRRCFENATPRHFVLRFRETVSNRVVYGAVSPGSQAALFLVLHFAMVQKICAYFGDHPVGAGKTYRDRFENRPQSMGSTCFALHSADKRTMSAVLLFFLTGPG